MIAIHGIVTTDQRRDPADTELAEFFLHGTQGRDGALRRRIAAIEKGVQINFPGATLRRQLRHGMQVLLVAVHATGRQQAHDVQCLAR